jgi:predicted nucleotidyltransferase
MAGVTPEERVSRVARQAAGLELLVLFGSRARGDSREGSDWDLGYLGAVDENALRAELTRALGTEAVDLVDLGRAGALLRFRAARDGRAMFESAPGAFDDFRVRAATFWCDAQPVLARAYGRVLEDLGP